MNGKKMADIANVTVDNLHRLAASLDEIYAEECAESGCTNERRIDPVGSMVHDMIDMAIRLNVAGMCDY
jgi:hypothetical protein